jgi:hypothetical protein
MDKALLHDAVPPIIARWQSKLQVNLRWSVVALDQPIIEMVREGAPARERIADPAAVSDLADKVASFCGAIGEAARAKRDSLRGSWPQANTRCLA